MFYSRRDIIWSLIWIGLMSILAIIPFQIGNGTGVDSLPIHSYPAP